MKGLRSGCHAAAMTAERPPDAAGMHIAVDVCYLSSGRARAALVAATDRRLSSIAWSRTAVTAVTEPYQPGEFWRRELPPLLAVLDGIAAPALIVIDGYVDLDPAGRPGLGARIHTELGAPVIGVAKTFFRGAVHAVPICRGGSARPLFVTAAGIGVADAAGMVEQMAGSHRIPDALRLADRLSRGLEPPVA